MMAQDGLTIFIKADDFHALQLNDEDQAYLRSKEVYIGEVMIQGEEHWMFRRSERATRLLGSKETR